MWPFAVQYAAHQLNLWPRVSLPETLPTLCWTGKVDKASVFRFYHPTSRRVFPSHNVTFDKSVPFYRLFPYRSAPLPPPLLFLAPGPPPVDPLPPKGPAPSALSQVVPLPSTVPVEVAVDSGAARGAPSGGDAYRGAEPVRAELGGAEPAGAEPRGAEPKGAEPVGAEFEGAEFGGAEPRVTASSGGSAGASPQLSPWPEPISPQQLREWFARRTHLRSGARGTGARGAGATSLGGCGAAGPEGATTRVTGAAGAGGAKGGVGAGGTGAGAAGAPGGTRATGAGGAAGVGAGDTRGGGAGSGGGGAIGAGSGDVGRPRPYFVPLLWQVLGLPSSTGLSPPLLCPPPDQTQPPLQPSSPLPAPSPYTGQTGGLTECREPVSRPASPVRAARTGCRVPHPRPPPIPSTSHMALHPSFVPQRVPLPSPPASCLADGPDRESRLVRAASPTFPRLLAIVVTDPSFESTAVSALVAELVDFAAACRLDYAASLVAEYESFCPPSVGGEGALGTDVLEDKQEDFGCFAAAVPHLLSMLIALERDPDAPDIPTPRSYVEAITGEAAAGFSACLQGSL
ncbi:unnamed protein product, partial [Closterium sp. NIES-53]